MLIQYMKNSEKLPVLYTLDKGRVFPLVVNKTMENSFKMEFSKEANKNFFSKLKCDYATVDDFDAKVDNLLKVSYTAESMEDCINRLDDYSMAILSLFKDFVDSNDM